MFLRSSVTNLVCSIASTDCIFWDRSFSATNSYTIFKVISKTLLETCSGGKLVTSYCCMCFISEVRSEMEQPFEIAGLRILSMWCWIVIWSYFDWICSFCDLTKFDLILSSFFNFSVKSLAKDSSLNTSIFSLNCLITSCFYDWTIDFRSSADMSGWG